MADALDLGSSTSVCGFKSHLPYYNHRYAALHFWKFPLLNDMSYTIKDNTI